MDSDDEYILAKERKERKKGRFINTGESTMISDLLPMELMAALYLARYRGDSYPVRLYEEEEQALLRHRLVTYGFKDEFSDPRDDPRAARGLTYRILRFFDIIKGFHTVYLTEAHTIPFSDSHFPTLGRT